MLLSFSRKIAFVSPPRTAGTSVGNYLMEHIPDMTNEGPTHMKLRSFVDLPEDWFVFTFVRHPLDRMVSYYHYLRTMWDGDVNYQALEKAGALESFEGFVRKGMTMWNVDIWSPLNLDFCARYGEPQLDYLEYKDKLRCNFIGRFETLERDFDLLCRTLSIPNKGLPVEEVSEHEPYMSYYNLELAQIVHLAQLTDFTVFGYDVPWEEL